MSRLIYLVVLTNDLDRLRRFYENALSLGVRHAQQSWVEYDTGGAILALHAVDDPEKRGIQLRFEASDIDRQRAELEHRGITFEHEVEQARFGKLNEFWDPEGRRVSLLEAPEPASAGAGNGLKLKTAILNSGDFARTVAFYRDQLGLTVAEDRPHWVEFDTGGTRLALHARDRRDEAPLHASQKTTFAFGVDDIDAVTEALRRRGAHFAAAPAEEEFGIYAEIIDPDGNIVVFRQPVPGPSLEERLAEEFEDDGVPRQSAFRKPLKKGSKAVSRLVLKPEYKEEKTLGRRRPSATTQSVVSLRGGGPGRTRLLPKRTADEKKARGKPAIGRARKAERQVMAQKKRAVARASKGKPVKRSAPRVSKKK